MSFREIRGHRPLLELLERAVAHGTLPHSLIFAGPEGVGKRLTATALAQALNCERPDRAAGAASATPAGASRAACTPTFS